MHRTRARERLDRTDSPFVHRVCSPTSRSHRVFCIIYYFLNVFFFFFVSRLYRDRFTSALLRFSPRYMRRLFFVVFFWIQSSLKLLLGPPVPFGGETQATLRAPEKYTPRTCHTRAITHTLAWHTHHGHARAIYRSACTQLATVLTTTTLNTFVLTMRTIVTIHTNGYLSVLFYRTHAANSLAFDAFLWMANMHRGTITHKHVDDKQTPHWRCLANEMSNDLGKSLRCLINCW